MIRTLLTHYREDQYFMCELFQLFTTNLIYLVNYSFYDNHLLSCELGSQ